MGWIPCSGGLQSSSKEKTKTKKKIELKEKKSFDGSIKPTSGILRYMCHVCLYVYILSRKSMMRLFIVLSISIVLYWFAFFFFFSLIKFLAFFSGFAEI